MADKKTMACPFCGEEILTVAKKCKHCGEFLEKKEEKKPEHFYKCYGKTANYKYGTIALWLIV